MASNSTPAIKASQSDEEPTVAQGLFGCALILALGIYLTWPIFDRGRPASFLCVGLFVLSGLCYLVAKWMKKPRGADQNERDQKDDPAKSSLIIRTASGLVSGTQKAALWTAVGFALVWLLQLFLNFLPERIGPDGAGRLQLFAYDLSHSLKSEVTPLRFLIVILALLAVSTTIGSLSPVNVAGTARKWAGIAASVLIAFSTMTFVTVQTGSARFDASVGVIRAAIGADLDRLRKARQEKAALQWLGASVEQTKNSPKDVGSWRSYLFAAAELCASAESEFMKGFTSDPDHPSSVRSPYCEPIPYSARVAARQLEAPGSGRPQAELWSWVPEWGALRGSAQSPRHLADLQAVAKRVRTGANDEERARNQVEASVVAAMMTMFPGAEPDAVAEVVKSLKQAVVEAIYRDSRDRVAMWLRLRSITVPRPIASVLGIEPELRLISPTAEISRAGGVEALMRETWKQDHPETLQEVRRKGEVAAVDQRILEDFMRGDVGPRRPGRETRPEPVRPKVRAGR